MKKVDYIVVGLGLAGISFCEQLRRHNKSFVVFDQGKQNSSEVAGGVYNPLVLKRYNLAWKAEEQLKLAKQYYSQLEKLLNSKLDYPLPILRRLASPQERLTWIKKREDEEKGKFMSSELLENSYDSINAPNGFGKVFSTGRIDTEKLILSYRNYLLSHQQLIEDTFLYENVDPENSTYMDYTFKKLVFAEGFGLKNNSYFKHLPLRGTKGEVLIIRSPKLHLKEILKSSIFIIPLKDDMYYVGATYEHEEKTFAPTEEARNELCENLEKNISCDYEIVEHLVGIRPTTKDRRPLVGVHSEYGNISVLNGLGTRGVMIAPFIAQELFNHLENSSSLDAEIDIQRFESERTL
ncbi:MAG: FAD-dependent oxidoreductase [Flavobacteriaceae bacterium]|nr:FAD-dependent oxidoreductase [Flavobacteriaceae bacterium]